MKKLILSIFLMLCMVLSVSALVGYEGMPSMPYIIYGRVTKDNVGVSTVNVKVENAVTGFSAVIQTNEDGYWQADGMNFLTTHSHRPPVQYGDTINVIVMDGCTSADVCTRTFQAYTGVSADQYKDYARIDFMISGVVPEPEPEPEPDPVCPDCNCPNCPGCPGCPDCPDCASCPTCPGCPSTDCPDIPDCDCPECGDITCPDCPNCGSCDCDCDGGGGGSDSVISYCSESTCQDKYPCGDTDCPADLTPYARCDSCCAPVVSCPACTVTECADCPECPEHECPKTVFGALMLLVGLILGIGGDKLALFYKNQATNRWKKVTDERVKDGTVKREAGKK